MDELADQVQVTVAAMDRLTARIVAVRRALAKWNEMVLESGPELAARAGSPVSQEQIEASTIDVISGEFDRARLRLVEALK